MNAPYPWLATRWQRLLAQKTHPPQALLIVGPAGVGKGALARTWAQTLLCEAPQASGDACGVCEACHWFAAGTHPDYRVLTLLEKENDKGETRLATEIVVDQAREAVEFVQLSTYRAGRRVVLVQPADALNLAAANALLKVLEEPPLNTSFLLVSDQPQRLLPTIRSRCTRLDVGLPPQQDALQWLCDNEITQAEEMLALSGGAPLKVVNWTETGDLAERSEILQMLSRPRSLDPVARAEAWKSLNPRIWHTIAYKWLCDMMATQQHSTARFNPDFSEALVKLGEHADLFRLLELAKMHSEQGRVVIHPLNRQLQLEEWLIRYKHVFIDSA